MASIKPSVPKGTRDFTPIEMVRRNFIFDTIKSVFRKYGYQQIETPAMENLSTLTGKYGDEGDKLIFKILNSGPIDPYLEKVNEQREYLKTQGIENSVVEGGEIILPAENVGNLMFATGGREYAKNNNQLLKYLTEKALRYDLTVPFARYVVQHQNEITFPFKRFQVQPVWRADRPQRGRYREFYQCDADVVGSDSLINEAEFVLIYDEALSELGLKDFTIKINNRKTLSGIASIIDKIDNIADLTVAIDKLDPTFMIALMAELVDARGSGPRE